MINIYSFIGSIIFIFSKAGSLISYVIFSAIAEVWSISMSQHLVERSWCGQSSCITTYTNLQLCYKD